MDALNMTVTADIEVMSFEAISIEVVKGPIPMPESCLQALIVSFLQLLRLLVFLQPGQSSGLPVVII